MKLRSLRGGGWAWRRLGVVAAGGFPDLHPGKNYPVGAAFATRWQF